MDHGGPRSTPDDTGSDTYRGEPSHREMMDGDLMEISRWLSDHPEGKKNLKPIRSAKALKPGVYYNAGTRMVERIFEPQRVALGHRTFRISKDPDEPAEDLRRKVMEGK